MPNVWIGNVMLPRTSAQRVRGQAERLGRVPGARCNSPSVAHHACELLVQVTDHLVGDRRWTQEGEQLLSQARRRRGFVHRPSSCDSTPFQSASNAARALRRAATPDMLTE